MAVRRARWEVRGTSEMKRFARKADAVRHARRRARSTDRAYVVLDTRR